MPRKHGKRTPPGMSPADARDARDMLKAWFLGEVSAQTVFDTYGMPPEALGEKVGMPQYEVVFR